MPLLGLRCRSGEKIRDLSPTRVLSDQRIEYIHENTIRILQEIGLSVPNQETLEVFEKNGAHVDFERQTVRLPEPLVMSCLRRQMENNRKTRQKHPLAYLPPMAGTMATEPYMLDYRDYSRRAGMLSDLLRSIVLGNNLPSVGKVSCLVIPGEYPYPAADALSFYLLYAYSSKPVFSWIYSLNSARCIIEMARIAARDQWQFQSGELLEYNVETISPLRLAPHSLEVMLECARNKVKMSCGPMLVMGSSAPMNHISTMTLENAEVLATLVTIILLNPENPHFEYVAPAHSMNMANGMCSFGNPNQALFGLMAKQLADHYGFDTVVVNCGLSDALYADFQSGIERGVTAAVASAAGIDRIGLMGIVGADQAASVEQLVIDDEVLCQVNRALRPSLAIPAGPRDFARTLEECGGASSTGRQTHALDRVREKIKSIESAHYPPKPVASDRLCAAMESVLRRFIGEELVERFLMELHKLVGSRLP